jgi:tetrahydromethanopterin S-methyltransferase subunit A
VTEDQPSSSTEPERPWAVAVMRALDSARELLTARRWLRRRRTDWPPVAGAYRVSDPAAPVAVCTLTDDELVEPAAGLPGVAVAGRLYTANLGIEKIVTNVTANPAIRYLLLCGRDSSLFRPAGTLRALCARGVDDDRRIIDAPGYLPTLRGVPRVRIERFRRQVELVDRVGETDPAVLAPVTSGLRARDPGPLPADDTDPATPPAAGEEAFVTLRPGGAGRRPLAYDPAGYFVISIDRGRMVVQHYRTDNTPAHQVEARGAEAVLQALLRADLITQLSHAGYLGAELAKAETALRLGLDYRQDRPLRPAVRS